jgi:hypothetical protein
MMAMLNWVEDSFRSAVRPAMFAFPKLLGNVSVSHCNGKRGTNFARSIHDIKFMIQIMGMRWRSILRTSFFSNSGVHSGCWGSPRDGL